MLNDVKGVICVNFKKWLIPNVDKQFVSAIAEECGLDPLVVYVAVSRGLTDPYEIEKFFSDEPDFSDPYEYSGISEAVDRIKLAIDSEEKILVFGDYDCDGVTATALVTDYLLSKGANVSFIVPDRETDGYGISIDAINQAANDGVSLIITVDNGINAINEVARANELGVDVVITDHHLPQKELPDAVAVIDPHVDSDCDWLFHDLCGVSVAFKLVCALEGRSCEEMIYEYGDLVALGTIADVVPLVGENRSIVKIGMMLINRKLNVGLRALLDVIQVKYVTSLNAAFTLCPRINAAGRIASAKTAVKLLLSDNYDEALYYAGLLDSYNSSRQSAEHDIFVEACNKIESNGYKYDRVIVVSGNNWHVGVIGIVASKITEKYSKPCIVINCNGSNSVGSGRSIAPFSLFNAISSCGNMLKKFGGHELAAGLTIDESDIDDFRVAINNYANECEVPCPTLRIDCRLKPRAFTVETVEALKAFEPYGSANPSVIVAVTECTVCSINSIASGKHIRIKFKKDDTEFWAVMFGVGPEDFSFSLGSVVDIAVSLDINNYNNTKSVSVIIKAIRKSGIDDVFNQLNLIDLFHSNSLTAKDAEAIYPTRDEITSVFKYIRTNNNVKEDLLINDLLGKLTLCKIKISLLVLLDLCIISLSDDGRYNLLPVSEKSDLESATTLKKLRLIMGGE